MDIISIPLGWIMWLCYKVIPIYGVALLLFTLITRALLFPLSIKQQKSTAKMAALKPQLDDIQKKYGKNKEKLQEETMKLYQQAGASPLSGCLPLILQMVVLFGLVDVFYNPLKHIAHLSTEAIAKGMEIVNTRAGKTMGNYDMFILKDYALNPDAFSALGQLDPDFASKISSLNMNFLGMFLGDTPKWPWEQGGLSLLLLIPILSGVTAFLSVFLSQKFNGPVADNAAAGAGSMKAMMYVMPLFSLFIAFSVPAGVGLYWIYSNLFMILQSFILHKMYDPKKYIAEYEQKQLEAKKKKVVEVQVESPDGEGVEKRALSQKEIDRMRLAEARRRDAEKYGEEYVEVTDDDLK